MTKLVKLSLAAAIAVSGLSSTVAAKPLEEAIKGVDVSGTVVYRYDDRNNDVTGGESTTTNSYKIAVNVKAPVNDMVTFNSRIVTEASGIDDVYGTGISNGANPATLDTQAGLDQNPSLNVSEAYFTAKMGALTVNAGKQGIATPWTVAHDAMGNDQTGTGIVALFDAGFATFAAAYFNQHNITALDAQDTDLVLLTAQEDDRSRDLAALAVIAPLGPVNLDIWYADLENAFDTYTIGLSGSMMGIKAYARYTSLDPDSGYPLAINDIDTQKAWEAGVSGDLGPVGLSVDYGNTDDGGLVALDCDATTGIQAWAVNACNKADADYWKLQADMDLMPGLNFALTYAEVDYENGALDMEEQEVYGTLTYQMSDNFMTYVRYGNYTVDTEGLGETTDQDRGRLHVQYSF